MIKTYFSLKNILESTPSKLFLLSENAANVKPAPDKWSKKEELGHLIDSATNNHQRFVRMQIDDKLKLPQYQQEEWISTQHYQQRNWKDIIELWQIYNQHLLHIISVVDESKLQNTADFPQDGILTLQFVIDDYVVHMQHHLDNILK